jgi:addiction module HigA family antidote
MATERTWPDLIIPPGEVLAEELAARGMTQSQLARQMGRPLQAINEIVRGKKRIIGETALQLADALGTSAELWMRLEADHELNMARIAREEGTKSPSRGATRADLVRRARRSAARQESDPARRGKRRVG